VARMHFLSVERCHTTSASVSMPRCNALHNRTVNLPEQAPQMRGLFLSQCSDQPLLQTHTVNTNSVR
jgi:hypothetical protein